MRGIRFAAVMVLACAAALLVHGERARACGGGGYFEADDLQDQLTFDVSFSDESNILLYRPWVAGFGQGAGCNNCDAASVLADWKSYLKETGVADKDWEHVLYQATASELSLLRQRAGGKKVTAPKGYDKSTVFTTTKSLDRLANAIAVVELARRVEPIASFEANDGADEHKRPSPESADVLADLKTAYKDHGKDAFLAQRYGFLIVRTMFYQRDWAGVVGFFDKNTSALTGPSANLHYRARYYLAGALRRNKDRARANLELARVHIGDRELAPNAAQDFRPKEDADWKEALRQAKDTKDKIALWRLVGLTSDGVAAAQEIVKLDPKSPLVALLVVRELAKAETGYNANNGIDTRALEALAQAVIDKNGDRAWLMELVLGHAAARKGDVAGARAHGAKANQGNPKDPRVANQVRADLAVALAMSWKIDPQHEDELAKTMSALATSYAALAPVREKIHTQLAEAYLKAGKLTDAELLKPGIVDSPSAAAKTWTGNKWADAQFIKDMLARIRRNTTDFDHFVIGSSSLTQDSVERDLAMNYLVNASFADAVTVLKNNPKLTVKLGSDPFAIRIRDCAPHEEKCDLKFKDTSWTTQTLTTHLADLQKTAAAGKSKDDVAAQAAIDIGIALYNASSWGTSGLVLEGTHQEVEFRDIEKWFKRGFDLAKSNEVKAHAAYYAAKAEYVVNLHDRVAYDSDVTPITWFAQLKKLDDTKYYKEVLKECTTFGRYVKATKH